MKPNMQESIARASDLQDMLSHIAWQETIQPKLKTVRDYYQRLLTQVVLTGPIVQGNGEKITQEMLAGKLYGLDFIENLFAEILRNGQKALEKLHTGESN